MEQYQPIDILKPFIKRFLILESEHGMVNRILPDTSIVMAFRLKGNVIYNENGTHYNLPASVITGIRESSRLIDYAQNTANLLVIFKEGGAAAFFKEPLNELGGISVSLDYLFHQSKVQAVEEELAGATANNQRIMIIERFLISQLKKTQPDPLINEAINTIRLSKGDIKIKNLIAGLPISRDPFEKRFRKITGTSPKHFSVIVRLKNLIDTWENKLSFTEAAYDAGYFDQAHFIKDFRSFTGLTPHEFFKTPVGW
jgi:AraC-like DNA-binding protein